MTTVKAFKFFLLQFTIFTLLACKVSASFREGEQENQNDFIWKDISDWIYSFTYSDYFEQKEGYVQAELISTPANPAAIQNYGLSHVSEEDGFNRWFYGYGFEADLYLVQNLNRAIIQWTDRQKNATSYFFSIKEDGTFSIDFSDGTSENQKIFSAALPESFSRTDDYNCLAVCSTGSGDIKIFLNQNLLFTIPKSQVNINLPGHFYLGFQPKSGVSYSQENKGIARFRLSKIQDKI